MQLLVNYHEDQVSYAAASMDVHNPSITAEFKAFNPAITITPFTTANIITTLQNHFTTNLGNIAAVDIFLIPVE